MEQTFFGEVLFAGEKGWEGGWSDRLGGKSGEYLYWGKHIAHQSVSNRAAVFVGWLLLLFGLVLGRYCTCTGTSANHMIDSLHQFYFHTLEQG